MTAPSPPASPPSTSASPLAVAPIAVAHGDGIGPEIMAAALEVLDAAGARLDLRPVEIGERLYRSGHASGIPPEAWDVLRETKTFLKAPITTPQGGGYKSLNVTIRKTLGLYANVRPCRSYAPFVRSVHSDLDMVIVRENEEDLYAGIEHRQSDEVVQCLKLVSRPGCERIVRYAFEYARTHGRKKVTALTKDNIMKLTDGLFHRVFDEIGAEYPDIEKEHLIVDIGMARVAARPERFDVLVTTNLYGDIVSDVAAEVAGSVGLAPSANIGGDLAMFEAIHGSAPDLAGRGVANPSGLLLAGVMMLAHLGQGETAARVHNAWLRTIERGEHTADVYGDASHGGPLGTAAFAKAVVSHLGERPETFEAVAYAAEEPMRLDPPARRKPAEKTLVGMDLFVNYIGEAEALAAELQKAQSEGLPLQMVTNRGVKVWPGGLPETFCTDHWRCRFVSSPYAPVAQSELVALIARAVGEGLDVMKTETLCLFDGEPGFSLGQGQ